MKPNRRGRGPAPPGTVGSSTMPQKRNPKLCQDIIALSAEVRAQVPLALEAMQTEHEADRTTSLIMDAAEARASIATGDILGRLHAVLSGLKLDPKRMRANLDLSGGLIMAEAIMLQLGTTLGRQHAHDIVYDAAQAAAVEARAFSDVPAADAAASVELASIAKRSIGCWIRWPTGPMRWYCPPVRDPRPRDDHAVAARVAARIYRPLGGRRSARASDAIPSGIGWRSLRGAGPYWRDIAPGWLWSGAGAWLSSTSCPPRCIMAATTDNH